MIKSIGFANYKAFRQGAVVELRPVTVLIGRNSSGKSSIGKLVQFVSDMLALGDWPPQEAHPDRMFHGHIPSGLTLKASYDDGMELAADYYIDNDASVRVAMRRAGGEVQDDLEALRGQSGCLADPALLARLGKELKDYAFSVGYIGPIREGAKMAYFPQDADLGGFPFDRGGRAYNILLASYLGKRDRQIYERVASWMEEHMDGQRVEVVNDLDKYYFAIDRGGCTVRIEDVGEGVKQVLPLVVQACLPQSRDVVVVEQPELHLHPGAHAPVAELLARSAMATGTRYVVETHSENVLLGLRRMVARRELKPTDIAIHYVDYADDAAEVRPIEVHDNGQLDWWPTGVFGESYDLLNEILQSV